MCSRSDFGRYILSTQRTPIPQFLPAAVCLSMPDRLPSLSALKSHRDLTAQDTTSNTSVKGSGTASLYIELTADIKTDGATKITGKVLIKKSITYRYQPA